MIYEEFRKEFIDQVCFTSNQVYTWYPGFDKNNLSRWSEKGYLIKLRNGVYTFNELKNAPNINFYVANRMYRPSYISLHTALAFYGLIPESVIEITNVSTRKTTDFKNDLGSFTYKNIKRDLFFGYSQLNFSHDKTIMLASPEKSLLDLLYLYPFYNTQDEMLHLRLDEDILLKIFKLDQYYEYLSRYKSKALEKRSGLLLKSYEL